MSGDQNENSINIWGKISKIWLTIAMSILGLVTLVTFIFLPLSSGTVKVLEIILALGYSWFLLLGTFILLNKLLKNMAQVKDEAKIESRLKLFSVALCLSSVLGGFWGEPIMNKVEGPIYLGLGIAGIILIVSTIWIFLKQRKKKKPPSIR